MPHTNIRRHQQGESAMLFNGNDNNGREERRRASRRHGALFYSFLLFLFVRLCVFVWSAFLQAAPVLPYARPNVPRHGRACGGASARTPILLVRGPAGRHRDRERCNGSRNSNHLPLPPFNDKRQWTFGCCFVDVQLTLNLVGHFILNDF